MKLRGCAGWHAPLFFACSYVSFFYDMAHNSLPHFRGKLKNTKEPKREKKRIQGEAYSAKKVVLCINHQREVSLDRPCRRLRSTSKSHAFEAEHERAH